MRYLTTRELAFDVHGATTAQFLLLNASMNGSKNSVIQKPRPQTPGPRRPATATSKRHSVYWLDATTGVVFCEPAQWKERDSFESALDDVRQACCRLDPDEERARRIELPS